MTYKTALAARPAGGTTGIGLGAAWALDETSGTIASELLGVSARNGTYTGTITVNQQALVPNSSAKHPTFGGGYVSIPNDSLFSPAGSTGKILVTAIVRPASLANGQVIVSKLGAGAQEWNLYANADGSVTVQILQSGGTVVKQVSTPAGAVAVGRTSSVAFYWTASGPAGTSFGDLELLIDGSLQAEADQTAANVGSVTAGTAALVIGGRADGGGTPWAGQIGFVSLYGSSDYGFWEPITLQRLYGIEGSGDVFDFGLRPDSATTLGVAETGESWTVPSGGGTWGVNAFRQYAAVLGTTWPNPGAQAVVPFSQGDMDVTAAIPRPNTTSKGVGVIARQSDASNFWFAFIWNNGGSNSSLYCGKVVAGTNTYSVVNALGLGTGKGPYRVRLRCKGDRIQVFLDGVLQGEVSDSFNNSATNAGLLSYDASTNSFAKNFRVSKPPAPVTGGDVVNEQRFAYTGAVQQFTVPVGVRKITVDAYGAAGGDSSLVSLGGASGGYGARVRCDLTVTPGEVLNVYVGGMGGGGTTMPSPGSGGFNGGGAAASDSWGPSVGGGGASDVRQGGTALANRVVVAGGAGGATQNYGIHGGLLAGMTGQDSGLLNTTQKAAHGGGGGSQTAGGAAGTNWNTSGTGTAGSLGTGGTGGTESGGIGNFGGGGGGGGLYGGGGGGGGGNWGGGPGGGGSGLSTGINELALVGAHYGNGEVRIQWETPAPTLLVGGGTALAATGNNRMSKSTDVGATWGLVTTPDDAMTNARGFRGIAWSPALALWVACATHNAGTATTGAHIVTSPDGTTWTSRSSPVDASSWSPEGVVWAPELSLFVLVGQTAGAALVLTSPDGVTWTQRTIANIGRLADVAWSGSLFMTVADNGNGSQIATSSDGITWSNRTLPVPAGGGTFTSFGYAVVIWEADAGKFVIGGNFSYNPGFGGSTYNVVNTTDGSNTTLCNGSFTGSGARVVGLAYYQGLGLTIMLGWTGSAWQIYTATNAGQSSNTLRTVPFNGTALNGTAFGFVGSDGLGDDATLYAGVYDNNGSVAFAKSSDGGQTWSSVTITGLASGTGFGVAPSVQPPGFFTISVAGAISSAGFLGLGNFIVTAGAISSSGTIVRQWGKVVAGQVTPIGTVVTGRLFFRAFSGSVGSTGSLVRQAGRKFAGVASSHGVVGTRVRHPVLAALRDLGSNIRLAPSLIRPVMHALGLDGQLATDAAWHSLAADLGNDGASGRVRRFPDGSTWLYVGLTPHGADHNLNLFDVTDPSRLKAIGVADLANVAGAPILPALRPDEWPRYVAVSTGRGAGVGTVTSAGMQIVDVGDAAHPLVTPVMGARHEVTFGSISGGEMDFIVQKDERSYWGATYGFVQFSRLEYEDINALTFDAAGEITWLGSSEFATLRRFVTPGGVVHHPTEDYLYCFGRDYTILWSTDPALGLAPVTLSPSIGQVDPNGNGYDYLQPMPDGPTLWCVRAIPGTSGAGAEIVYIDVSNPLAPVESYVWRISNDGRLMGGDPGFIQAVYDKRNLRLTVRRGSGPFYFDYFLYDLDIVARKVNSVLQIPNPNSPGADITPQGTFTNRDYYGWWTSGAVYLFRALPAPNLTTAVRDARLTTGRPGIAVR